MANTPQETRRAGLVFPAFVLACGIAAYCIVIATGLVTTPERSDGLCHYVYLPAWVVHHDTTLKAVADTSFGGRFPPYLEIVWRPGTGRWLNSHQAGVAVMCLPFYLGGHAVARLTGTGQNPERGPGFSFWERHAAGLAASFYLAAGLFLLRRLLARTFSAVVVLATLACLTFGTNLFHYATYDSLWTHAFSFFLFSAFLVLTDSWTAAPSRRLALLAGLTAGLIGLVRLPNLALLVFFGLYGVSGRDSLAARLRLLRERWLDVWLVALLAALLVLPQLLLFRAAAGEWANPYSTFLRRAGVRHAFNFASPHLAAVLFSPAKGLFVWAPILLLAIAGMVIARRRLRPFLLPATIFVGVQAYIIASWYDWELGGSFGHRGFTETAAVFAMPMAAFFEVAARRTWLRRGVSVFGALAVALCLAQMLQYWLKILPIAGMTWEQYRALFLKF